MFVRRLRSNIVSENTSKRNSRNIRFVSVSVMMTYLQGKLTLAIVAVVVLDFITTLVHGAASAGGDGLCFRAESLGHREGNLYYCKDPSLPVCCERDNAHTCCQAEEERSFSDQVILWGFVCLTILCFGVVYYYFTREGDYWESDTVRQAAHHMATRFGLKMFSRKKRANNDRTPIQGGFDTMTERASTADAASISNLATERKTKREDPTA